MKTIFTTHNTNIEIKKSNFISYICPFEDFKDLLQKLKKEHVKAVHFVYAYRYLNEFNQIIEDKSDDGEPKGTSGLPSLNVLRGNDLINIAVIIVRYFGGIKLGTGGLARAYSQSVNEVIKIANLQNYEQKEEKIIQIEFNLLSKLEHFLNKNDINFSKEFGESVKLKINLNKEEKEKIENFLKNM